MVVFVVGFVVVRINTIYWTSHLVLKYVVRINTTT